MKKIVIASALIFSMTAISAAQADKHGHHQKEYSHHQANDHHDEHGSKHNDKQSSKHNDKHGFKHHDHGWKGQRFHAPTRYVYPPGYVVRTWRSGAHLPATYRTRQYYVDHRHYHLSAPPIGYQYIRVDNDVVLIAIASGVIVSVLAGMYY
jgi:Ni/Co efflux regulator RcnB